jgi:16S rRNA processing protein RimM
VAAEGPSRRLLLGRIAGAHGIRGEVLIHAYTGAPEDIAAYGPLTDAGAERSFEVRIVRTTPKGVVARIPGIADRTAAEALKGVDLYVSRDRLPTAAEDEFYHADLIGLAVVDRAGKAVGEIVTVQNYGAGDLLEIRLAGSARTELVPFTEAVVPEIDIAARRVVVLMPATTDARENGPERAD